MFPLYITWEVSPIALELGPVQIRWYGLMFAAGFLIGYWIVSKMFKREGISEDYLDSLLLYLFVGTVVGARLGHVFFWSWDYYSQNLHEIPMIWKGGLASHGAMVVMPLILIFYAKRIIKKPPLWLLDRVAVPIALTGSFIRIGNLMNSEIIGKVTDVSWGFIFKYIGETQPRHPSQLYESFCYFIIFWILMYLYWRTEAGKKRGLLFGLFMTLIFSVRFLVEFTKQHFEEFEVGMMDTIGMNLGQTLSVPAILVGLYFIFRAKKTTETLN